MQAAANRARRQVQNFADRLVATTFDLPQDQDGSMLLAQCVQCPVQLSSSLFAQESLVWGLGPIGVAGRLTSTPLDQNFHLFSSLQRDRQIEGDPVQPRVE